MRIRTIKPEFWISRDIANLPDDIDRLLFIGLWNYADDEGRGRDDERLIRAALFPLRDDIEPCMVDAMMWGLHDAGLIRRYMVGDCPFFEVVAWSDHQRVNRPTPSKYPTSQEGSVRARTYLTESSSAVDNGGQQDSVQEGNREQGSGTGNREQGDGALRAVPDNRPDEDQAYLAGRLADAWGQELGYPALQKLNNQYGRVAVTDAMRQMHGFPPAEAIRRLYAYIEEIAAQAVSA